VNKLKLQNVWVAVRSILFALLLASIATAEPASSVQGAIDFHEISSVALTSRAWTALAAKDFDAVAAYTGKCRELYEAEARRQQSDLASFIPSSERDRILSLWALNDVAVCYLIAGQSLEL
jgi:hypothetical protein